jgi:hypothetical protein
MILQVVSGITFLRFCKLCLVIFLELIKCNLIVISMRDVMSLLNCTILYLRH